MKREEKKRNYNLLSESDRLRKQLLIYKFFVFWMVACFCMNVTQAYVLPYFINEETENEVTSEVVAELPSEMEFDEESYGGTISISLNRPNDSSESESSAIEEWLAETLAPATTMDPIDNLLSSIAETTSAVEDLLINPVETIVSWFVPTEPTVSETTPVITTPESTKPIPEPTKPAEPSKPPIQTEVVETTTPTTTTTPEPSIVTPPPGPTTTPSKEPVTTQPTKPAETTSPPVETQTPSPTTSPIETEPPTTQPVETQTPTTQPVETTPIVVAPPKCTVHQYVFDHQEVSASYQVYNTVIKTYVCSVCGEHRTENVTVPNRGNISSIETQIAQYINSLRASVGCSTLWIDDGTFKSFARVRAQEISYYFGHSRPNGEENSISNGTYYIVLENINAGGYSAESIFNSFKNSNAHYRAMIYEDAVGVAVGVYITDDGTAYTQVSIIAGY